MDKAKAWQYYKKGRLENKKEIQEYAKIESTSNLPKIRFLNFSMKSRQVMIFLKKISEREKKKIWGRKKNFRCQKTFWCRNLPITTKI